MMRESLFLAFYLILVSAIAGNLILNQGNVKVSVQHL